MKSLTVLYDARCGRCRRIRRWLAGQAGFVPILFVDAGSAEARRRFPSLDPARTLAELTAVDDEGGVYRGAKAWILCLWALERFRGWAMRLATPSLWPRARELIEWGSARLHAPEPGEAR